MDVNTNAGPIGPVLVVGSGFLGHHVAESCVAGGREVIVLARHPPPAAFPDVPVVVGDATNRETMRELLWSRPHVVWCAGTLLPAAPSDTDPSVDLEPLGHVLDLLVERRGAITFFSSGGAVYGDASVSLIPEDHELDPRTVYGAAKVAAERMLARARGAGVRTAVLRCANVYGPAQQPGRSQGVVATALDCARRGAPVPLYGDGSAVRDYVFADDVTAVVQATIDDSSFPGLVNVGSGRGTTLHQLLVEIRAATGVEIAEEWHARRPHDFARAVLNIGCLRSALPSYRPRPLGEGLAATWAALAGVAHSTR